METSTCIGFFKNISEKIYGDFKMKINSIREISTSFNNITSLHDLPESIEVEHKGNIITLDKIGSGSAGGKLQIVYISSETEMVTISYTQDDTNITVTEAKFRDVNTMNTSNAILANNSIS